MLKIKFPQILSPKLISCFSTLWYHCWSSTAPRIEYKGRNKCEYKSMKLQNTYIERLSDAGGNKNSKSALQVAFFTAAHCFTVSVLSRISSRVYELQASSNDSRLIGEFPYHLRMSLGVLALDDFATKPSHFGFPCSVVHCQSSPLSVS